MGIKNLMTKRDFQDLMMTLLNPLKEYYTPEHAGINLGVTSTNYDEKAILMECFSRPLWGLVPFFAGGGSDEWFQSCYQKGLVSGTNPSSKEFWGVPGPYDQRYVEMASISYGILLAPHVFWDPFSEAEQNQLVRFLNQINKHDIPECNWQFFRVIVNLALKKVGKPYSEEQLEASLQLVESFYLGDGWYRDGDSNQKDYYVPFALHFYALVYAKVMEHDDSIRSNVYKERAMKFAKQFIYWFDDEGAALPFGRSLDYRFAQVSFFSACLLAHIEPFPVDVMKGLIVRHLNYWMKQPIFDRQGILSIGYAYPNLLMAERYNGPGSAYWGMKVFAFLALPDDHVFFKVNPKEMPIIPDVCAMLKADMLVKKYKGHVTAYVPGVYSPNGHGQIVAKYGKFAYDTFFGFSIAKSSYELHENCPDSMLAFIINGYVYVRRICEASEIKVDEVYSKWSPYPGITVETTITLTDKGHIRKHRIMSDISCEAYDCGFSVAANLSDKVMTEVLDCSSRVENKQAGCQMLGRDGEGIVITSDPNTNVLYPKTLIPAIKYQIQKGTSCFHTECVTTIK